MPSRPNIVLEREGSQKRELQERLTSRLPEWFGHRPANVNYAQQAEVLDGYVAVLDNERCGLLLLKWTSAVAAELYWLGVDPARHRCGIGRALVDAATAAARARGAKYLFVSTLHPRVDYEPYRRTRRFYEALGFSFVLEDQQPADAENPLAFYMKIL